MDDLREDEKGGAKNKTFGYLVGRENAVPTQALGQLGNHLKPSSESKPPNFNQQGPSNPQIVANK